jgi:DNA-binding transcriptional MerR regulator
VGKSEKAFRTITEVAEILELPAHVLRFWESKFKYIKPMKRGGGRRYYRPEDIRLLLGIKHLLYSDGLTIKGAQKFIQTNGVKATITIGSDITLGPKTGINQINSKLFLNGVLHERLSDKLDFAFTDSSYKLEKLKIILLGLEEICNRIKVRSIKKVVA